MNSADFSADVRSRYKAWSDKKRRQAEAVAARESSKPKGVRSNTRRNSGTPSKRSTKGTGRIPKPCKNCGETFTPRSSLQVYCAKDECRARLGQDRWERKNARAKSGRTESRDCGIPPRSCAVCGDEFRPSVANQITCRKPECRKERVRRNSTSSYMKRKGQKA